MKGATSLLLLTNPTVDSFALHFKKTQALMRTRSDACNDEPSVVDWNEASVDVLSSAADYCLEEEECDADELINIKSAFEGRLDFLNDNVLNYQDSLFAQVEGTNNTADVSGATAEDQALRRYVKKMQTQGLRVQQKIREIDDLLVPEAAEA